MKTTKRVLSVALTAIMIFLSVSAGATAFAADVSVAQQYNELATFLADDWVRQLDHYEVSSDKATASTETVLNDDGSTEEYETKGFSSSAHSFIYVHKVVAVDNTNNSILKAANRFYTIYEKIRSTDYGVGLYSPNLLYDEVTSQLESRFDDMNINSVFIRGEEVSVPYDILYDSETNSYGYVDFYGNPVTFGTPDDVAAHRADYTYADFDRYHEILYGLMDGSFVPDVIRITDANRPSEENNYTIPTAILSANRIPFRHMNAQLYYNYETVIRYFMGNCALVNSGNWFHKYYFIDTTDLETSLIAYQKMVNAGLGDDEDPWYGVNPEWATEFDSLLAVYGMNYTRTWDSETGTKPLYAFSSDNSLETLKAEAAEYLPEYADRVTDGESNYGYYNNHNDFNLNGGHPAGFSVTVDTATQSESCAFLNAAVTYFDESNTSLWAKTDEWKLKTDAELAADSEARKVCDYYKRMTDYNNGYHTDMLNAVFGPQHMGSIANLAMMAMPNTTNPERVVREGETDGSYVVTATRVATFISNFDALMNDERLGATIREFLPTTSALFKGSTVYGQGYKTPMDLVQLVLKGKLFTGEIVSKLMKLLYPLIFGLLEETVPNLLHDKVGGVAVVGGILEDILSGLIDSVINNNHVYYTPALVADRVIRPDGGGDLGASVPAKFQQVHDVLAAAGSDWDAVNWDLMDWKLDGTAEDFSQALSIMLFGLRTVLAAAMTNQDLNLIKVVANLYVEHLEGYNKIIIPIFKTLGMTEYSNWQDKPYAAHTGNTATDRANGDKAIPINWWSVKQGDKYTTRYLSYQMYLEHSFLEYGQINSSGNFSADSEYNNGNRAANARTAIINDILGPIISWVEYVLLEDPIGTICTLLPNLAYLLGKNIKQDGNYATYNVNQILDAIDLKVGHGTLTGIGLGPWSIGTLGGFLDMDLGSVDAILDKFVDLTYDTGVEEPDQYKVVAYRNPSTGQVTLPGSDDYNANPVAYSEPLKTNVHVAVDPDSYEFNVNTPVSLGYTSECTFPYSVHDTTKVTYKLPHFQDNKLIAMGTPYASGNARFGTLSVNAEQQGRVLLYVLRFVLGALQYRYLSSGNSYLPTTTSSCGDRADIENAYLKYGLIECFGLDLDNELFSGLTLGGLISNINYHAEDAICAIMMLFSNNENGNLARGIPYTYPLTQVDYYDDVLLDEKINPSKTFGNAVKYSDKWTRADASFLVENVGTLVDNILDMLKVKGLEGGLDGLISSFANEDINENTAGMLLSLIFGNVYSLTSDLFDLNNIVSSVLGADMSTNYAALQYVDQILQRMGAGSWEVNETAVRSSHFYRYLSSTENSSWGDIFYPVEYQTNSDGTYVLDGEGNRIPIPVMVPATNEETGEYIYDSEGGYIYEEKFRYVYDDEGNIVYQDSGHLFPLKEIVYEHTIVDWKTATQDYCSANNIDSIPMGFISIVKDASGKVTDIRNPFSAKYQGKVISMAEGFGNKADLNSIVFDFNLELFENLLVAVLSPLSIVLDFLFYDRDLDIFNLINISSYAGYYYALAPLYDALDAPAESYVTVYNESVALKYDNNGDVILDSTNADARRGNRNSIYYFIDPLVKLVEEIEADPIEGLLSRIPNLMFFITIGGLNTVVNDLVHFGYVLIDAVKPVLNAYDLINGLLSNLVIGGSALNLSLPLDIDVNNFLNNLLESNIGNQIKIMTDDETGAEWYLALPYIDLTTLCAGTLQKTTSIPQTGRSDIVRIESKGGADLFTAAYRLITEVLFMNKNAEYLADFLRDLKHLDGYDDDTLRTVLFTIQAFASDHEVPDYVMKFIVELMRKLLPITSNLAEKFNNVDFALQDLLTAIAEGVTTGSFVKFNNMLEELGNYGTASQAGEAVSQGFNLLKYIADFFKRLFAFITALFKK